LVVRLGVSWSALDHQLKLPRSFLILAPTLVTETQVESHGRRLRLEIERRKEVPLRFSIVVSLKIDGAEIIERLEHCRVHRNRVLEAGHGIFLVSHAFICPAESVKYERLVGAQLRSAPETIERF